MAAPTMTWKQILACSPCASERKAARAKLKAALPDFDRRPLTLANAASAGIDLDSLIWIAGRAAALDADCARRIRLFGADCAARVAHIANDPRSTAAIVAGRAFARREIDDAARAVALAAARYAWGARAAGGVGGAAYAAMAAGHAWYAEQNWQLGRLVAWFSDDEPTDWPISNAKQVEAA
jgi:hypothetical protein